MDIVIRYQTRQRGNVHIAVHPLRTGGNLWMMHRKGNYGSQEIFSNEEDKLPHWMRTLSDDLWDSISGLHLLFIGNGQVTLQHNEVFDDEEIAKMAEPVIRHHIELNERLLQAFKIEE